MDREELWKSMLLIIALLALAVLAAQSRRNCEVPGSSFVPCVSFNSFCKTTSVCAVGLTRQKAKHSLARPDSSQAGSRIRFGLADLGYAPKAEGEKLLKKSVASIDAWAGGGTKLIDPAIAMGVGGHGSGNAA